MRRVEVAIVGAGFAGLGMAMALRREGIESVVVLERADAVGGTWRDNTYPGVACDVPSHLYGFAAHPNPAWSRVYARGDEIRAYLEGVADAEGIAPGTDLTTHPRVLELIGEHVAQVNTTVSRAESIREWRVVPGEWTPESGDLTPTMKMKRSVISTRAKDVIEEMYSDRRP